MAPDEAYETLTEPLRQFEEALADLPPPPLKVGLLLPLSGASADVGQALLNAAQLALFDLGGDRFPLVVRDTPGPPEGAAAAAESALADQAAAQHPVLQRRRVGHRVVDRGQPVHHLVHAWDRATICYSVATCMIS